MNRLSLYSLCLLGTAHINVATASPVEAINAYPACDYDILDTVSTSKIVNYELISGDAEVKKDAIRGLVNALRDDAKAIGAVGIALIDRELRPTLRHYGKLTLTAELISDCKSETNGVGKPTPYNADGLAQAAMKSTKTTLSHTMTVNLDKLGNDNLELGDAQPELGDDHSIDTETGVYGLPLGASKQQMLDKFGIPTFEFIQSDNSEVFAYGRSHWLTFRNDAMVAARYGSSPFTSALVNYLPFDERFDYRVWEVTPSLKKSASLSAEEARQISTTRSTDAALLNVKTDAFLVNNQKGNRIKVNGFALLKQPHKDSPALQPALTDNGILSYVFEQLQQGNSKLDINTIPYTDFGRSHATKNGYHLFNAYTLIESTGNSVSKIHINPNFMTSVDPSQADWRFGDFYFGQSESEALAVAGDNAFYFDHLIEYDKDNYTAKIFLEKQGDKYRVYSMEVSVY